MTQPDSHLSVSFGARLQRAMAAHGRIVAGIDPHASILSSWGLDDSVESVRRVALTMLDACAGRVAAIKPQSAFFERFGSAGIAVLEDTLALARERGILTILDVKRGDIGSTMGAYAAAYLAPGAPLEADAITVNPYLGFGSLEPCFTHVREDGKGLYVLALTSNPDGPQVQHAVSAEGPTVAGTMCVQAARLNADVDGDRWGSVGLVVGATVGDAARRTGVDLEGFNGTFLAPGFGAQGAGPAELRTVFGRAEQRVLVSMSRSIMAAGPQMENIAQALDQARVDYGVVNGEQNGLSPSTR